MPIITEQMVDTNVGVMPTARAETGNARALQQLGSTATDIMLDITQKRTEIETNNTVASFEVGYNDFVNLNLEEVQRDAGINWTLKGDEIKDNIRKNISAFTERAATMAPNDVAREKVRLMGKGGQEAVANRLEAIHASKVIDAHEKLYDEVGGSAIATLGFDNNALQADTLYKSKSSTLLSLRGTPYSDPRKLQIKDAEFTSRFAERFAAYGELRNPVEALSTFSPELGSYIKNYVTRSNFKDKNVNPFADLAFRGQDGQFYFQKYNPVNQTFSATKADIDPSLYPDAAYINTSTKEVIVSQKQLMSSPRTPQFVKDLYERNPDKAAAILNNLLTASVKKRRDDATLQQKMINDNFDKAMSGKITTQQAANSLVLAGDPVLLSETTTKADKLDNFFKAVTPIAIKSSVDDLLNNPAMGEAQVDEYINRAISGVDSMIESKDPIIQNMIADLGDGDYETGKTLAKSNKQVMLDKMKGDIKKTFDTSVKEFQADGASYLRKRMSVEQQEVLSNFFKKGIYGKEFDARTDAILSRSSDSYLSRLKQMNFHTGSSSVGMTNDEEKEIASFLKLNTANPEAQDNVLNNLQRVIGPQNTADFLDRNGLSGYRSFAMLNTNMPLRVEIVQAEQALAENVKAAKVQGLDPLTLESGLNSSIRSSELVKVLSVGGGVNQQMNTAAIASNIKALMYQHIVKGGMNPSEARNKAIKDFTNSFDTLSDGGYDGRFYLYAPKGGMKDKESVKEWIEGRGVSPDYLEKKSLVIPEKFRTDSKGLYNEQELRRKWVGQISSSMKWITNHNGTGARLMYRDQEKNLIPVFVEIGKTGMKEGLEITYEEMISKQKTLKTISSSSYPIEAEGTVQGIQRSYMTPLQRQIEAAKFRKETEGVSGLSPDVDVETSAAATYVDPQWLEETLQAEGETAKQGNFSFERVYVENKPDNFLHSMRVSNFKILNSTENQAIVGETPIYTYKENGKEYVSYLPISPKKYLELSESDKRKYDLTLEVAARKTMKNWTRVSTNPEVARFMQGRTLTQNQFHGIADIWHTMGASKLLGSSRTDEPSYKKLGDLLREKKFDDALGLIKQTPILFKELGANTYRFKRLARLFGGNRA